MRRWAELDWETVAGLLRGSGAPVVALLPVGATEAHGPHLPLGTDGIIAEAAARAAAEALAARGAQPLLLPPLWYAPAPFAAGFPGTLSLRAETLTMLVEDVGRSLARHGVRLLAVANAHLDPAHLGALARAGEALEGEGLRFVFPDLTRRRWAERLTAEFRSGACHAGAFESSVVLAERPDLVNDRLRATLPSVPHSLSAAIREGKRTFEEAGGPRAYFGAPAAASAEEGRATVRTLGSILEEAVLEALGSDGVSPGGAAAGGGAT